jgi:NADH:ubiquinone oxidoreductase subunit H
LVWLLLPLAAGLALVAVTAPEAMVERIATQVAFEVAPVVARSSGLVAVGTLPGGSDTAVSGVFQSAGLLQLQLSVVFWAAAVGLPAWLLRQARLERQGSSQASMG